MFDKQILRLKRATRFFIDELVQDPNKKPYFGDKYFCPCCKKGLAYFEPFPMEYFKIFDKYQFEYTIFQAEMFNFAEYTCPNCGIIDRERLYILYFEKVFKNLPEGQKLNFLDIAPNAGLSNYLRSLGFLNYRSADLQDENADDKVDITDMHTYGDNQFDVFLCSHVLEHVKEDKKALKELYRVLKPEGWGLLIVPMHCTMEETLEDDDNIVTEADRWRYYGQHDHVRMYSKKGFLKIVAEAGFKITQLGMDYFGEDEFVKHGIHPRSILYVVEKK